VLALLKGLPKRLRKLFVPLPDTVDRLMDSLTLYQGSLYPTLEQIILRQFQVTVKRADWQLNNLPSHLRMRFRLCDEQGKTLHCGRSFHELERHCGLGQATGRGGQGKSVEKLPEIQGITDWDFSEPPQPLPVRDSRNRMTGLFYPALFIEAEKKGAVQWSLTLKYIADFEQARIRNREGLRFLYSLHYSQEVKAITKECKAAVSANTASWLSLGMKAGAADTKNMLLAHILDSLFQLDGMSADLPNKEQMDALVASLKERGMLRQGREGLNRVLALLTERRKTQVVLTQSRQRAGKSGSFDKAKFMEYQQLLDELVPSGFLTISRVEEVGDKQRWLQALAKRIERAEHAPLKDEQKAKQVRPALERLRQIDQRERGEQRASACQQELSLYRRMVEEFRVSVFAPEIRTAMPVSEKRLKQQWQRVEDSCRRVE
jgi:ATP-dependent helicase HrpA